MPQNHLLDSDILIWFLRGKQNAVALVNQLARSAPPAYSALSILEVMSWVKPKEEAATRDFLQSLHVYPLEETATLLAAQYVRDYRAKGRTLALFDAAIAATCVINNLVLVTYNKKDFPMPDLKIYPIKTSKN